MFEILKTKFENGLDYIIKKDNLTIFLYDMDWNGEIYSVGYYADGTARKNYEYKPVYKQVEEDEFELIGFEER